jgi:hypothetical protein
MLQLLQSLFVVVDLVKGIDDDGANDDTCGWEAHAMSAAERLQRQFKDRVFISVANYNDVYVGK